LVTLLGHFQNINFGHGFDGLVNTRLGACTLKSDWALVELLCHFVFEHVGKPFLLVCGLLHL
jgi:hypothetical protein